MELVALVLAVVTPAAARRVGRMPRYACKGKVTADKEKEKSRKQCHLLEGAHERLLMLRYV